MSPWFTESGACWATVTLPAGFKKLLLHCDSPVAPPEDKQPSNCALPPMLRAAPSPLFTPTHQLSIISNWMRISAVQSVQSCSCQHESENISDCRPAPVIYKLCSGSHPVGGERRPTEYLIFKGKCTGNVCKVSCVWMFESATVAFFATDQCALFISADAAD